MNISLKFRNFFKKKFVLKYKKYQDVPDLKAPNPGDAGIDVYSAGDITLDANEWTPVSLGIAVEIPEGYCGLILSRSGLRFKQNIFMSTGLIDENYRGILKGLLKFDTQFSNEESRKISKHEKVGQLLIIPYLKVDDVLEMNKLSRTDRGESGFGSTGRF